MVRLLDGATRVVAGGALSLGLAACHAGAAPNAPGTPTGERDTTASAASGLEDAAFAESAYQLLRQGKPSSARTAMLARVVDAQLRHAAALFERGDDVRGAQAVLGAFSMTRTLDAGGLVLSPTGAPALDGALRRFSARGDEGRALALTSIKRPLVAKGSAAEKELDAHLEALKRWRNDTRSDAAMAELAVEHRQAVARALLEPSEDRIATATTAVARWIERAVAINVAFQETRQLPERDEAIEAFRALRSGAYVMAALYLRHGRVAEALQAIETTTASRVVRPDFFARLRAAAEGGRAEDLRMLAREYSEIGRAQDEDESPLDPEVLASALWGIGLEAFRLDPSSLAVAHLLAAQLVVHEMPEVAPLVLADALGVSPAPATLNGALEVVAEALGREEQSPDVATARRIFAASVRLLALADQPGYQGLLRTSAAKLRAQMASLELRAGNATAARELMTAALRAEPTISGLGTLGTLERQLGDTAAARMTADRSYLLAPRGLPDLDAAQSRLLTFELERDAGNETAANRALDDALAIALDARRLGGANVFGLRAELLLARILDGYGERDRAARALGRALELADVHRTMLPHTMLAAIGRAVALRDVSSARAALGLGLKADTDRESLVYGALWLGLLERQLGETTDGKVDRILADAVNAEGWTARLARWYRGGISDAELAAAARNHSEAVEAEFYAALRAWASQSPESLARLKHVASDPLIDLYEVRLARDLLAPKLRLAPPKSAPLP